MLFSDWLFLQFLFRNHVPTFPSDLHRQFLQIELPSSSIDSPDLGISLDRQTASGDCLDDCLNDCLGDFLGDFCGFIPFQGRYLHPFNQFHKRMGY